MLAKEEKASENAHKEAREMLSWQFTCKHEEMSSTPEPIWKGQAPIYNPGTGKQRQLDSQCLQGEFQTSERLHVKNKVDSRHSRNCSCLYTSVCASHTCTPPPHKEIYIKSQDYSEFWNRVILCTSNKSLLNRLSKAAWLMRWANCWHSCQMTAHSVRSMLSPRTCPCLILFSCYCLEILTNIFKV